VFEKAVEEKFTTDAFAQAQDRSDDKFAWRKLKEERANEDRER
jgi:hypothetical protein